MKREPLITVTDAPDPRVAKLIGESLRRFNAEKSGIDDSRPLAVVVSDPDSDGLGSRVLGWRVFGEIPCEPPGTSRIFMTKTL